MERFRSLSAWGQVTCLNEEFACGDWWGLMVEDVRKLWSIPYCIIFTKMIWKNCYWIHCFVQDTGWIQVTMMANKIKPQRPVTYCYVSILLLKWTRIKVLTQHVWDSLPLQYILFVKALISLSVYKKL